MLGMAGILVFATCLTWALKLVLRGA
jgi:hypothetical protein